MLLLKKKEVKDDKITYYYQPEFKGDFGIVSFYIKERKLIVDKVAEKDNEITSVSVFRRHVLAQLIKFIEEKNYPEEKKVYWGY